MKKVTIKAVGIAFGMLFAGSYGAYAQDGQVQVTKNLDYRLPATPEVLDNYTFSTYIGSEKKAYNLKGFEIVKTGGRIIDLKMNPAGYSYAVISVEGRQNRLRIFDTYRAGRMLHETDKGLNPTAIAYSADSKSLYVADVSSTIRKYDSKSMQLVEQWNIPIVPTEMRTSGNNYYIAAYTGSNLVVINPEDRSIRKSFSFPSPVRDMAFSEDSSLLAVLLGNGDIELYGTRDFNTARPTVKRSGANAISFHPDNKYIAVAKQGNEVELVNIIDNASGGSIAEPSGKITYVKFLKDGKKNIYLTFNALNSVKYKLIKGLIPNYSKLLREEVLARMEEWSKMAPDETEEEYRARVNEDSRLLQARLFEEEIATRLAEGMLEQSTISLGSYNLADNTLTIDFDNMPSIFLTVPENEAADFMDMANLEFRNVMYGVTENDKFEVVYAEVYNKATGKSYEFNNRERKSLDYLYASGDFVPIELVRQSGMEEMKLTSIKDQIVEQAKRDNLISDHTNIDVSTAILTDVDANGNKITNYKVGFKYTVDEGFSAKEDFPAGKYKIEQSNAANSMLRIIRQAFEKDFAQYIVAGKKVQIKLTGTADALPITGRIAYDGSFGEFENEPLTLDGELSTITLTRAEGIRHNEQLAFTRALAVKDYITSHIRSLEGMNTDYRYIVEVSDKKGGEYRRIQVEFLFVEAF